MPDAGFEPLNHWKRHAQQLTHGLLDRVHELSVSDYPEATANELIRFLQEFLSELSAVIEKTNSEDRLRALSLQIKALGEFLGWLDNAHTGQTPRGLVQLLKTLINQVETNSRVVVWPQGEYNYRIGNLGLHLKYLVDNFIPHSKQIEFEKYLQHPIKLISFPRIERDNILTHAIFGHELGHPIADKYLSQEGSDEDYKNSQLDAHKQVSILVEQMLTKAGVMGDETKKLEAITQVFDQVLQVRRRALQELISDAVGILLFGPSALFAFFEFLWSGNWDVCPSNPEWYPPSRMRIRYMLSQLDNLGFENEFVKIREQAGVAKYIDAVQKYIAESRRVAANNTDTTAIDNNQVLKIAYEWMQKSLGKAISFATVEMKRITFNPSPAVNQLPALLKRLELGVPPNEIGDPLKPQVVDYRNSLLAGWIYKLGGMTQSNDLIKSSKETERLYMQTIRAIEYVLLQEEYSRHLLAESEGQGK